MLIIGGHALAGLFHDMHGTLNGKLNSNEEIIYGCTCNVSVTLSTLTVEFDEDYTIAAFEDLDWCFSARAKGVPITYTAEAVVEHCYRDGPFAVFQQFWRYGAFHHLMVQKHPTFSAQIYQCKTIPAVRRHAEPTGDPLSKHMCLHAAPRLEVSGSNLFLLPACSTL